MDSPPPIPSTSRAAAVAAAAPSKKSAAPASQLDALSEFEVSQVTTEIATELFGVAPAIFTSRFVNLANDLIYHVVDKVDVEVHKRWAAEGSATTTGETLEERKQRVMKGVNRLETLLMNAVDIRFDQAEVFFIRNIFNIPTKLVPYMILSHHPADGFPPPPFPTLTDVDEKEDDLLMKELEQEIRTTNQLREEILLLDTVQERFDRRAMALRKIKSGLSELLSNGGARDVLGENAKQMSSTLPAYLAQCRALLATAKQREADLGQATSSQDDADDAQPWKRSREAYLYWRTQRSLRGSEGSTSERTDEGGSQLARDLVKTGGQKELSALRALMETES